jgi:hypoxanthine phosphoribosyltransferase
VREQAAWGNLFPIACFLLPKPDYLANKKDIPNLYSTYGYYFGRFSVSPSNENKLVILGVLNGSFVFMADLARTIPLPLSCEFIKISSYSGMESTGKVMEVIGIPASIEGKNVLVVEDIVDTGNSMAYLKRQLESLHPKRIAIATLLFKKEAFLFNYPLDYVGFEIPNKFVVGFGLDYDGEGRNYPNIYQLSIP